VYGMASSSSLQPSRLDLEALNLNSASEWSDTKGFGDLLRSGGAAVRQGPTPIRVPARSGRGTLELRGPRAGGSAFMGGHPAAMPGGYVPYGGASAFHDSYVSPTPNAGGSARGPARGGTHRNGRRRVGVVHANSLLCSIPHLVYVFVHANSLLCTIPFISYRCYPSFRRTPIGVSGELSLSSSFVRSIAA
jgi:hypothetical protein